ncbi:MAG: ribose-5-phosphate isomerase RpiA [Chitinophagaceae bacterium]
MLAVDEIKKLVAEKAAELVERDMVLGIGSGSTVVHFITALSKKLKAGLQCISVPTSSQTRLLATKHAIKLTELNDVSSIDLTIDGADEMDHGLQLIKGGGGYLLQEKMVAVASKKLVIIADHTKLKSHLGIFPLPIEVIPYGWKQVKQHIEGLYSIQTNLRTKEGKPFETDHGHYILDCSFKKISYPSTLNTSLHLIPGVVETGLFVDMCQQAIIGYEDGRIRIIKKELGIGN